MTPAPSLTSATPGATDESATPLVELRGVRAAYGPIEVLHGVDLALMPGEVLAVLGPNGAGKTTTLNVLAGLHPLSGGDVFVAGRRVNGASRHRPGPRRAVPHPRGARHLPEPHGAREPAHGEPRPRPRRRHRGRRLRTLPPPRRPAQAGGRHHVGRRAADARPRPGPGHRPGGAGARRAVDGPGAARGRRAVRTGGRAGPHRASRCWWSSSSPASSSASPIAPPSCCTGAWPPSGARTRSSPSCPRHTWVVDQP